MRTSTTPSPRSPSTGEPAAREGPRIFLLPDAVKSRIAAGEVIERPASVVKELVENSLDAGAKNIQVEIAGGGTDLIRVSDDGSGMSREDLALCIRRHATSKLRSADDLYELTSMGFRGEALPSIGSVSKMVITTRMPFSDEAWKLVVHGGENKEPVPASGQMGTVMDIQDLFFNLPARRKFLKSPGPEAAACSDAVLRLALVRPDVSFVLTQGSQELLRCPAYLPPDDQENGPAHPPDDDKTELSYQGLPVEAFAQRIRAALGRTVARDLVVLSTGSLRADDLFPADGQNESSDAQDQGYRLFGLVTPPARSRPNRSNIFLSINDRPVKDRVFMSALTEAYRHLLPPKRFPAGVLFLTLPGTHVDINVHPTKAEVRFRYPSLIFSMLHRAVREAFQLSKTFPQTNSKSAAARLAPPNEPIRHEPKLPFGGPDPVPFPSGKSAAKPSPAFDLFQGERAAVDSPTSYPTRSDFSPPPASHYAPTSTRGASTVSENRFQGTPQPAEDVSPAAHSNSLDSTDNIPEGSQAHRIEPSATARSREPVEFPFRILGQAGGAYIVVEDESGVKVIDQHALHERILFEGLMEKAHSGGSVARQHLLLPETLELTPIQAAVLGDDVTKEVLTNLGYEVTDFGPRTIAVNAVPHLLKSVHAASLLREVLDAVASVCDDHPTGKKAPDRSTLYEKAAYVLSCKGAIKAGERLNARQMEVLLQEYVRHVGAAGFTCPHGRPLAVDLSWEEIERRVGRT